MIKGEVFVLQSTTVGAQSWVMGLPFKRKKHPYSPKFVGNKEHSLSPTIEVSLHFQDRVHNITLI